LIKVNYLLQPTVAGAMEKDTEYGARTCDDGASQAGATHVQEGV